MSSSLSAIPAAQRRRAAASAGLAAAVLVPVGILPWAGDAPATLRFLSTVVLLAAVLLGLIAWGLVRSIRFDTAEAAMHAVAAEALAQAGGCGCGHDHDPEELHVTDACPGESSPECTHSCETCLLRAR